MNPANVKLVINELNRLEHNVNRFMRETDHHHSRTMSSFVQRNTLSNIENYPPKKFNTVFNVCPQGYKMTVERLGKFQHLRDPGWFWAIPFVDKIRKIDDREMVIDVVKQYAYTSDNVSIGIAAQLYVRVTDVYRSCYEVERPMVAVVSHTQSAMRASVGKYHLDDLLKDRKSINEDINVALCESEKNWGVKINRVEITELTPDLAVANSMDLQAKAERERRQTEKKAEADKRTAELTAEGEQLKLVTEAKGRAEALHIETEAQMMVIDAMTKRGIPVQDALQYQLTYKYLLGINSLAQSGKHTTYFMGKDISDVNMMIRNVLHDLHDKK